MEQENKDKIRTIAKTVLRILLGLFFIATAVMKLLSIENFELYIYSFNLFGFGLTSVIARLVIAFELLVGAGLIAKIQYRKIWWLTMSMLIGFTLLLIYVAIFRHDANCHCMGDVVELSPVASIIKNIVVMALMLLVRKEDDYFFKGKLAVGIAIVVAALVVPYGLFPTDGIYNMFSKNKTLNTESFTEFMQDSLTQTLQVDKGNYIFGYVSAGCGYCKLGTKKLNSIVDKNDLNTDRIVMFIWGKDETISTFKEETGAYDFRYSKLSPIQSIQITGGLFPTFVYVQDGKIVKVADLKGLEEKKIIDFIGK